MTIVAPADAHVLSDEEGNHALGCQLSHRFYAQIDQPSATRQEEE